MPYGEGYTDTELDAQAALVAGRFEKPYVIEAPGVRCKAGTWEDALIIARSLPGATIREADRRTS